MIWIAPSAITSSHLGQLLEQQLAPAGSRALSVSCVITSEGLPFGFQLTGRAIDEAMVYRIAQAHERNHDWHLRVATAIEDL